MAEIEKNTYNALKKHSHLVSTLSMERVWDVVNGEFFKSFKQAKDFQQYLDFLTDFGIMEQILPGLKVNSKITNQDSVELVLSQMLSENDEKSLKIVMNKISIPTAITNKVIFLKQLLNFDPNKVLDFHKARERFKVDNNTIEKWFKIRNVQDIDTLKFIKYTPTTTAKSVVDEFGLDYKKDGRMIGQKIKEKELELFKNL